MHRVGIHALYPFHTLLRSIYNEDFRVSGGGGLGAGRCICACLGR